MRLVRRTFGTALAELESDNSEPFLSERSICFERSLIEFFPNISPLLSPYLPVMKTTVLGPEGKQINIFSGKAV